MTYNFEIWFPKMDTISVIFHFRTPTSFHKQILFGPDQ